jgi:hypothetical protein
MNQYKEKFWDFIKQNLYDNIFSYFFILIYLITIFRKKILFFNQIFS